MICREASLEDQAILVEFQIAMARETERLNLDQAICAQGVAAVFKNPHYGKYYVAEKAGQVIGSLLIIPEWSDWRNGVVWWIHSVYVVPSERRNGVFSLLYQTVKSCGEAQGNLRGLRLYVDKTNVAAQTVYRRMGMSNQHYELFEWMRN